MIRWLRRLGAVACLCLAAALPGPGWSAGVDEVELRVFWSETCPHCREARPVIDDLARTLPWLRVLSHEISRDADNARLYQQLARLAGEEARYVPAFLFCGEMHVGFAAAETPALLRQRLEACHDGLITTAPPQQVTLPVVGVVAPDDLSLPLLTVLLGALDAFNPCAFFVLLFLLGLMTHARSRTRMMLVGGLFVATSGVVYFLFMAAWLNLFLLTSQMRAVTMVAGALALGMGALNVKDYFLWGQGPTLSIPATARSRLFERMRRLVAAQRLPAGLAGTMTLAVAANSYELLCTAGFPMVFTRVLTLRVQTPLQHYLYLALYNVVYVLPLLAIVAGFVFALGSHKLSERQGRLLKLVSGLMMGSLGMLLMLAPQRLDDPLTAIGLPLAAVATTVVIAHLSRRGPRLGQ